MNKYLYKILPKFIRNYLIDRQLAKHKIYVITSEEGDLQTNEYFTKKYSLDVPFVQEIEPK